MWRKTRKQSIHVYEGGAFSSFQQVSGLANQISLAVERGFGPGGRPVAKGVGWGIPVQ